jgi:4-hydroxybenzoate polyprenyltransferase
VVGIPALAIAVLATCLVASSNYVLNELLDGPNDLLHPEKRFRPVPSGRVRPALAYAEWLLLAAAGFGLALTINWFFFASAAWLWLMGIAYNVPPLRTKGGLPDVLANRSKPDPCCSAD